MLQKTFNWGDITLKVRYISSNEDVAKAVSELCRSGTNLYGLDIETIKAPGYEDDPDGGLCPYRSNIRLVQICAKDNIVYIFDAVKAFNSLTILKKFLEEANFVSHNASFELRHLKMNNCFIKNIDCSMILAGLVNSAEKEKVGKISLKACALDTLGINMSKELQASDWSRKDLQEEQLLYAAADAYVTRKLALIYLRMVKGNGMGRVYGINKDALHVVSEIQLSGIMIHQLKFRDLIYEWEDKKYEAEEKLSSLLDGVNFNSSKQMTEWLTSHLSEEDLAAWTRTRTGALKTDADTLQEFKHLPFIEPLATYKEYSKLCSTYGRSLFKQINPVTNRLHGGYTLGRTETGRMSSIEPNNQNYPRDPRFREIFIPDKGKLLIGADYSQIELRVIAEIAQDKSMRKAFKEGNDLHKLIVSMITGKDYGDITKEERQLGKSLNFGLTFGQGAAGLKVFAKKSYGVDMTMVEADGYVDSFHEMYAEYTKWKYKQTKDCGYCLQVRTPLGKLRQLTSKNSYTCSLNHPVQGGAGEVMLIAIDKIHRELKSIDAQIINVVHDEVLVECDKEIVKDIKKTIETKMTEAMLEVFPKATTNGLVDIQVGRSWQEVH